MTKKLTKALVAVSLAALSFGLLSACGEHEHSYADGWFYDEHYHWRLATCGDIEKGFVDIHNMVDGACTLCGYVDPNYVPPEKPGTETPGESQDPETQTPEEPTPPDSGSSERPKPSEGDEPISPDDPSGDDPSGDAYYDSFYVPEDDYTWAKTSAQDGLRYTEMMKDGVLEGYAVSADGGLKNVREVKIPATYQGKPVLMVDNAGFGTCASLEQITLPEGMLFIGEEAFKGCSSLWSVTVPSSVWLIGKRAFYGCSYLTQIALPEGVKEIRYAAFQNCAFEKFTIPNSVRTVASLAFYECGLLKELNFGSGVENVGGQAFCNCGRLNRVNISDLKAWCDISFVYDNSNPLNCGAGLYLNGTRVTKLEIPEGCGVRRYSFCGCASIEEVTIPSTAGTIGEGAFMRCSALQSVHFLEGADEIDEFAFGYCYKLTELVLPDSMKTIRMDAIYYCTNLQKVVFGKGIALLEMDAFTKISSSVQYYYRGSEADWRKIVKNSSWTTNPSQIIYDYTD